MLNLHLIKTGYNPPEDINVIVEIPFGTAHIKYEIHESGLVEVDRFMNTAMFYPANYGFIPGTKAGDGDPIDTLVITPEPLVQGCIINCRPIGVLEMRDEAGEDEKIISVPSNKITSLYQDINTIFDIQISLRRQIEHFFKHYKDLDHNKWSEIGAFQGAQEAKELIKRYIIQS